MMEQNSKPNLLYIQFMREFMDLTAQLYLDRFILNMFTRYQIEKYDEAVKWADEVTDFRAEVAPEILYRNRDDEKSSSWCNNMISRIRMLRAKRGLIINLTFPGISDIDHVLGSSSSLKEQLCYQVMLLTKLVSAKLLVFEALECHNPTLANPDSSIKKNDLEEVDIYLKEIQPELQAEIYREGSNWYCNKIKKARRLIYDWDPCYSLHHQHPMGSSSSIFKLHEELACEIGSLYLIKFIDCAVCYSLPADTEAPEFMQGVTQWQSEVRSKILSKLDIMNASQRDSIWYSEMIAKSRTLAAKRNSEYPFLVSNYNNMASSSHKVDEVDFSKELRQLSRRDQSKAPTVGDAGYRKADEQQYNIFLSFRGEDTRYNFTGFLYHALHDNGFKVFMDDRELHRGDPVAQVIMKAIENTKLSIIVFSRNFADSTWCLDEVVKILECNKNKGQRVWPVFYKVEPSDVRHQKNNFEKAMAKQDARFGKDSTMVRNWRSALHQVCGFNAFHYKENSGYERDFIQGILTDVINIRDRL